MLGFLKKKGAAATAEFKRMENRDLMEAVVAGSLLIAAADGEIEEEELKSLEAQIASNPSLEHFGGEIGKVMTRFEGMLNANFRMGKLKILREIDDVKNTPEEAEEVFVTMIGIAEADGEIEPQELDVLREVGQKLGVRLSDYGIEG